MATVSKFANANTNPPSGSGWTALSNPTYAYADDTSYASRTSTTRREDAGADYTVPAFSTSDIPDGSTINSITLRARMWGTNATYETQGLQAIHDGAVVGSEVTGNNTSEYTYTRDLTPYLTLADLRDANTFGGRVRIYHGNTTTSYTGYCDWVDVIVDFTAPVAKNDSDSGTGTDTGGVSVAKSDSDSGAGTDSASMAVTHLDVSGSDSGVGDDGASGTIDTAVAAGADDAYGIASSTTFDYTGVDLLSGDINASLYDMESGLRFQSLAIPAGATITAAHIGLKADGGSTPPIQTRIRAEDADDPGDFSGDTKTTFFARARTTEEVFWTISAWTTGVWYDSDDISAVLQEVIDRAGWASGNDLVVFWGYNVAGWGGSSSRLDARSYDGAGAPTLHVEWEKSAASVVKRYFKDGSESGVGYDSQSGTISQRIASTLDDVTTGDGAAGLFSLTGPPITGDMSAASYDCQVGLRFPGLTIPAGATITLAHLSFFANNSPAAIAATRFYAQDADNPGDFNGDNRTSYLARPRTSEYVDWTPAAWSYGTTYDSADIASVIQAVIDRAGWASGNALVIFWETLTAGWGGTDEHLTSVDYTGSPGQAALLHLEWEKAGVVTVGGGSTPQSDSDSGTGTDTATALTAAASGSESGAGTDTASVVAAQSASDSGAGTDTATTLAAALAGSDSGAGSDSASVVGPFVPEVDAGLWAPTPEWEQRGTAQRWYDPAVYAEAKPSATPPGPPGAAYSMPTSNTSTYRYSVMWNTSGSVGTAPIHSVRFWRGRSGDPATWTYLGENTTEGTFWWETYLGFGKWDGGSGDITFYAQHVDDTGLTGAFEIQTKTVAKWPAEEMQADTSLQEAKSTYPRWYAPDLECAFVAPLLGAPSGSDSGAGTDTATVDYHVIFIQPDDTPVISVYPRWHAPDAQEHAVLPTLGAVTNASATVVGS